MSPSGYLSPARRRRHYDPISVERSVNRKYRATPLGVIANSAACVGTRPDDVMRRTSRSLNAACEEKDWRPRPDPPRQLHDDVISPRRQIVTPINEPGRSADDSRKLYLNVEFTDRITITKTVQRIASHGKNALIMLTRYL